MLLLIIGLGLVSGAVLLVAFQWSPIKSLGTSVAVIAMLAYAGVGLSVLVLGYARVFLTWKRLWGVLGLPER